MNSAIFNENVNARLVLCVLFQIQHSLTVQLNYYLKQVPNAHEYFIK